MPNMNRVKWVVAIVVGILLLTFLSCAHATFLPSTEKVNIRDTEVKRSNATQEDPTVRDKRYILARRISDGEAISFLNEDTRWGWPFYLKFNAADLAAQASDIKETQPDAVVLIKYYGFRSSLLDEFPNIVSMKIVDKDYVHIPVFNILFYVFLFGAGGGIYYVYRRLRARKEATKKAA
jgi:hypothetical protein